MHESVEGVRIWLSGSIPQDATVDERQRIERFTETLAKEVFRRVGRLVHGSHPTIRDTLVKAAQSHLATTGDKAGLVLVVSRYYSKHPPAKYGVDVTAWNQVTAEPAIETRE